ncbi:MAG: hypothetical protein V4609_09555 [Pseudomonadota bacterium]
MQGPTAYTPRLEISRLWDKADGKLEKAGVMFLGLVGTPLHVLDVLACGVAACRGRPLLSRGVAIADASQVARTDRDRKHVSSSDDKHSDSERMSLEVIRTWVVEPREISAPPIRPATYSWRSVLTQGCDPRIAAQRVAKCILPSLQSTGRLLPDEVDNNFFRSIDAPDVGWSPEQKVKAGARLVQCLVVGGSRVAEALEFVLRIMFPPAFIHNSAMAFNLNSRVHDRELMGTLLCDLVMAVGGQARIDEYAADVLMRGKFPGWDVVSPHVRARALGELGSYSKATHARAVGTDGKTANGAPFALDRLAADLGGVLITPANRKVVYSELLKLAPTLERAEFDVLTRGLLRALTGDPERGEPAATLSRKEFRRLALDHLDALREHVDTCTYAELPKDRSDILLRAVSAAKRELDMGWYRPHDDG